MTDPSMETYIFEIKATHPEGKQSVSAVDKTMLITFHLFYYIFASHL